MSSGGQNNWTNGGRGGRGGRGGGYAGGRTGRGTLRSRGTGGGYAGRGRGAPSQQFDLRNATTEPASMRAPQQQHPAATPAAPRGGAAGRGRGHECSHGSSVRDGKTPGPASADTLKDENLSLRRELSSAKTEAAMWQSLYEQTNSRLQLFENFYHEVRNHNRLELMKTQLELKQQAIEFNALELEAQQADLADIRAHKAVCAALLASEEIVLQILEKKKQIAVAEVRRKERKYKKWAERKAEQGLDDKIDWDDNLSDVSTDVSTDASDDDTMDADDGRKDQDKDEDKEEKSNSA